MYLSFSELKLRSFDIVTIKSRDKFIVSLFINSFTGSEKIAKMLIERGADVNALNIYNSSAISFAAGNGNDSNIFNLCISIPFHTARSLTRKT